jgi:hypothetical protein
MKEDSILQKIQTSSLGLMALIVWLMPVVGSVGVPTQQTVAGEFLARVPRLSVALGENVGSFFAL